MWFAVFQYCEYNANDAANERNESNHNPDKLRSVFARVEFLPDEFYRHREALWELVHAVASLVVIVLVSFRSNEGQAAESCSSCYAARSETKSVFQVLHCHRTATLQKVSKM